MGKLQMRQAVLNGKPVTVLIQEIADGRTKVSFIYYKKIISRTYRKGYEFEYVANTIVKEILEGERTTAAYRLEA